ncbi:prepilin-type N-terminal cleavage/methylation domain-containing protein [Rhodopirellula bahusiensis]|uniref:Membrane or secreted protein containing Prepilin-type cleavage/methylation n=1 Tax=Rhodopirellula bahusiensis TaxID=2014065 RepID=A0A2G1W9P8_9BACT|nr:prepilin-type N-terminal cleavage/methylation domain-containing protein [Rhodopirellula bahusiensis]PHQ35765.1 membrane or secreted protein containing Prepilin-type cleavage/methylation [Rhodopirellula bahusiensis]
MKRTKKNGFSLLEVIAAVVILAVVAAATVATVAPMRAKSEDKLAEQDIASLNAMAQTYYLEIGSYPRNIAYLVRENYIKADDTASRARYNKLRQYPYDAATGTFSKPVTN